MNKLIIIAIATGVLCLLFPLSAFAAGFAILQQGTAPMAQGNAFVAQADDPSAIFFNPAGINQLRGTQIYIGATAIAPRAEYKDSLGTKSRTESHVYLPLQFYLTHELTTDLAVGLGVFSPFGLGTKWDDGWAGRYLATSSDLQTFNINPVLSWKASKKLSVAGGVNVMRAEADLRKKLNLGTVDGNQLFKGADYGYGYNLGLLYQLTPTTNIGLSYRSKVRVKIDGDAEFSVPPAVAHLFPNGGAHSRFVFPPSLFAGIAYKGLSPWVFECDLTWTGWSTFEELRVTLDRPVSFPPKSVSVQPRNWDDVFAYRFGVNYKWDEAITLRAGYIFDESPVPDETMDPSIPDADRHIFCLGGDYRVKDFTIGLAYNYILGKKRDKNNTIPVNGEYQQTSHSLAVSISYSF
ncbi:MAG: outer membrane protein transport protein [Deltaproteobacteria bacterium]|nr:outer membrane protein transport protein [Deltaproteobacteria bacterium]